MLLEHSGKRPQIHHSAYVAPTATVCGDVKIGENSRILFGTALVAEGGPVEVGSECVVMENAVVRGTRRHPVRIGDHVLVGPHAYLTGCVVEYNAFLATGSTIFNAARVGRASEVRIGALVHLRTVLPPESVVPIGWVAVGDLVEILPPEEHERIWEIQHQLDFPATVFGMEREPAEEMMPKLMGRYSAALGRHREDQAL